MRNLNVSSVEILIRDSVSDDFDFFITLRNSCVQYLHDSRIFTGLDAFAWFQINKSNYYIVEINSERAGYFRTSNLDLINKKVCIGMDLTEKYRGVGVAPILYRVLLKHYFETVGLNKVYLEVLATNVRAKKLYEKLGFFLDGVKRQDVLTQHGYVDSLIMSITSNDYISNNDLKIESQIGADLPLYFSFHSV